MKKILFFIVCFIFISSCSENKSAFKDSVASDTENPDDDAQMIDETEALFSPDHLIDVKIQIDEQDWNKIILQGRGLATTMSSCSEDYEYTYFKAEVTVDGETIKNVGVRKKGYLGSLSAIKPSLKINFGKFVDDQTYSGMKRMTLNNDKQDPSHTHQVMSYALFKKAGVITPRCNFSKVTVNGKDLGIYSHVESIKKPFLRRNFSSDEGNLYEGQIADFTPEQMKKFQLKTNEKDTDGLAELEKVVEALYVTNTDLKKSVEKIIDLDSFLTFWAMESIVGHWDGYNGDKNNFYIYLNPDTGLFSFIPWGTDGAFKEGHGVLDPVPNSVYAWSQLAYRLYNSSDTRNLYHEKIKDLLESVWDSEELLTEIDRIEKLVSPPKWALDEQKNYILKRKEAILKELVGEGPDWPYDPYGDVAECREPTEIKGSFNTSWIEEDDFKDGTNISLEMTIYGQKQVFSAIYNDAGPVLNKDGIKTGNGEIRYYAVKAEGNPIFVILNIPSQIISDKSIPFHGLETFGAVYEIISDAGTSDPKRLGYIGDGSLTMIESGTEEGDRIVGSFEGLLSR